GGPARDHVPPRGAGHARTRDRPPAVAGAPARTVSRAYGVGAVGPLAGASPVARRRRGRRGDRAAHLSPHADPSRPPRHQLVPPRVGVGPGARGPPRNGRERRDSAGARRGTAPRRRVRPVRTPLPRPPG